MLQNPPTRVGNLSTASADFVSLAAVLTAELSEVRNVGYNLRLILNCLSISVIGMNNRNGCWSSETKP